MTLPLREMLNLLMPPSVFYRRRIAHEIRSGEPELAMLASLVQRGGTAIDVGANQGLFAFALSEIVGRVVAFEPNPDYAFFSRWMLRGHAEVKSFALSDQAGHATFTVPVSDEGMDLHFAGSLKPSHAQFAKFKSYDVEVHQIGRAHV